jgi:hypothetical protein
MSSKKSKSLNDAAIQNEFAASSIQMESKGDNRSNNEIISDLQKMTDRALTVAGISTANLPQVIIQRFPANTELAAYDSSKNQIIINVDLIRNNPKLLSVILYHELQHVLDTKTVAEFLASQTINGKPLTASEINAMTRVSIQTVDGNLRTDGISVQIAQTAINDYNAGKRQTPQVAKEAEAMRQSMFTKAGLENRYVLLKRATMLANHYDSIKAQYDESKRQGRPLQELQAKLDAAKLQADLAVADYRNKMPEESRAYKIQDRYETIYDAKKKALQRNRRASVDPTETAITTDQNLRAAAEAIEKLQLLQPSTEAIPAVALVAAASPKDLGGYG